MTTTTTDGTELDGATDPEGTLPPTPSVEKLKTAICAECGCESPLTDFFRKTRQGRLCPRCLPQVMGKEMVKSYIWLLILGVVLSAVVTNWAGVWLLTPLLNFCLFIALLWVVISLHEAIHGLTAWALGGRVFEIALGAGQLRRKVEWRGVRFSLRQGLILGLCVAAFPQTSYIRLRWLIFISAPLIFQSLLVVWLLPQLELHHFVTGVAVAEVLVTLNLVFIVTNLYPKRITPFLATDGHWLWELLRGRKRADELHGYYYALAGTYAAEKEEYAAALAISQKGLERYPQNDLIRNVVAVSSMGLERYAEAAGYFERFLAEESAAAITPMRGVFLCNQASALLHQALEPAGISPESLTTAHAAASEAFFLLPWISPVEVVRALSLYFQGHCQAAIALLTETMTYQEKDTQRAALFAYIALAQHGLGETDAARRSLAQARGLDAKGGRTLERIAALVEADQPNPKSASESR